MLSLSKSYHFRLCAALFFTLQIPATAFSQSSVLERLNTLPKPAAEVPYAVSVPNAQTQSPESTNSVIAKPLVNKLLQKQPKTTVSVDPTQPLDPEVAFKLTFRKAANTVPAAIQWDIATGYYLYADKIGVFEKNGERIAVVLPKALDHFDTTFNKNLPIFRQRLELTLDENRAGTPKIPTYIQYQGCADIGICYPPQSARLDWNDSYTIATITAYDGPLPKPASNSAPQSLELSNPPKPTAPALKIEPATSGAFSPEGLLADRNLLLISLGFFGFGLLLSLTPCVWPMVPIVSAMILNDHVGLEKTSAPALKRTFRSLKLTLSYLFGMAFVYALLGVIAGALGAVALNSTIAVNTILLPGGADGATAIVAPGLNIQAVLQQPGVVLTVAALLCVFAGAQFSWYSLTLPSRWTNVISKFLSSRGSPTASVSEQASLARHKSSLPKAALTGAVSALLVSPCVTAPLAASLGYIAQTGAPWIGAISLFCLALGMGAPLLLLAIGGAQWLPKSGAWMERVKYISGLLMLALAWWTVRTLVPSQLFAAGFALLGGILAVLLGVFKYAESLSQQFLKAVAVLVLLCSIGVIWTALLEPTLSKIARGSSGTSSLSATTSAIPHTFTAISDMKDLDREFALAQINRQGVVLDFYADWCATCIEMERYTLSDPAVVQALTAFKFLRVDVTRNTPAHQQLMARYRVFGPPALLFTDSNGLEIEQSRVVGYADPTAFLIRIRQVQSVLTSAAR